MWKCSFIWASIVEWKQKNDQEDDQKLGRFLNRRIIFEGASILKYNRFLRLTASTFKTIYKYFFYESESEFFDLLFPQNLLWWCCYFDNFFIFLPLVAYGTGDRFFYKWRNLSSIAVSKRSGEWMKIIKA